MNKQLRKFFLRGKSNDHLSRDALQSIINIYNRSQVDSLSGALPNEVLAKLLGYNVLDLLTQILI